jgi:alginate O-acetyltransferase complex protein AlgI
MLPTTPEYYCFLVVVFLCFWLLRRSRIASLTMICAANLFFFAHAALLYLLLIPAAATVDFFLGQALGRLRRVAVRRLLVSGSIVMNVSLIALTKYVSGIALPLSLSFYAFQALTYTIDIYRNDSRPAASYLQYLASVSFFPTVLAGPITRVSSVIAQWNRPDAILTGEEGSRALFLIGLGLFKKFMIADYLGSNLVNRVFDLPTLYSGGDVLVAVYAYAFQLYYDFSGYSDIAVGAGLLLGIRLPVNFNAPYRALNITDFWNRWHITFSKWLREYLYFSLPGPRTKFMPYLNLIITMAVGGLWHGLGWTFLIWGLLHGTALAAFRFWQLLRKGRVAGRSSPAGRLGAGLLTFHFVLFAWIFFRAANLDAVMKILGQIASLRPGHISIDNASPAFLLVLLAGAASHFIPKNWYDVSVIGFSRTPAILQAAALTLLVVGIRYVGATGASPFIYSKF